MPTTTRRTFLQTAVAAVASFLLPRGLRAEGRARFWFLHTETGDSWPVTDPVTWAGKCTAADLGASLGGLAEIDACGRPAHHQACHPAMPVEPDRDSPWARRRAFLGPAGTGRFASLFQGTQPGQERRPCHLDRPQTRNQHSPARRCLPLWRATDRGIPARSVPGKVATAGHRGAGRLASCPVQWVELLLGGGRAAPDSLAGFEVGLAARERPALPELRPAHPPDRLRLLRLWLLQARAKGRAVCPLCSSRFEDDSPWDGPEWMRANLDEPLLPSADLMFGHPVTWTLPSTRRRAGPSTEAAAAGHQDVGGTACRWAGQRSCPA